MEMKLSLYEVIIFTWYTTGQSGQCWTMKLLFNLTKLRAGPKNIRERGLTVITLMRIKKGVSSGGFRSRCKTVFHFLLRAMRCHFPGSPR
jgi:hypothetical protein